MGAIAAVVYGQLPRRCTVRLGLEERWSLLGDCGVIAALAGVTRPVIFVGIVVKDGSEERGGAGWNLVGVRDAGHGGTGGAPSVSNVIQWSTKTAAS